MSLAAVTIARLENAITLTAYVMQRHDLPQLLPTLKRLENERDQLRRDGDPIEYAKRVLERSTNAVQQKRRLAA
jgi:hypothetical protein